MIGLALAACLLIYAGLVEPLWVEVTIHRLHQSKAGPDQHTGQRRVRIAQLSDLHLQDMGWRERRVAQEIERLAPDLVILSGDVIDRADALPVLDAFLDSLRGRPTVAVLGNWEHWAELDLAQLRATYEKRGRALLLVNARSDHRLEGGAGWLQVHGLDDHTAGQPSLALPGQGVASHTEATIKVLVQHSPGWFDHLQPDPMRPDYHLCLAGHTHGGQVTLLGWPLWTPAGSGAYRQGFYATSLCPLFVSRGIGTSLLPLRLGARPQIAVFDL